MSSPKESRLKKKLELRDFKLDALLKVTQAINSQSSEEDLMGQYVDALKSNLGIDRLVLYAADLDGHEWKLLVAAGTDASWPDSRPASFFSGLDLDNIGLAGAMGGDEHPSDVVVPVHQNDEAIALVWPETPRTTTEGEPCGETFELPRHADQHLGGRASKCPNGRAQLEAGGAASGTRIGR